jgi:four helix bundle protein
MNAGTLEELQVGALRIFDLRGLRAIHRPIFCAIRSSIEGSAREIRTQLIIAKQRAPVTESERLALDQRYEEIGKMLTGRRPD